MPRSKSKIDRVLELLKKSGALRPCDLARRGLPREYLSRLHRRGLLARAGRGLYYLPETEFSEKHTLAEVGKFLPNGVVCLLSALAFHGLTTQLPPKVWVAIAPKAWRPKASGLPLHIAHFSGPALSEGVEKHLIEGVPVKIYSPAKTVADCFKYRNKIGLEVAIEALRDCRRQRKCTNDELWRYAKICRVAKIMKPYLETVI